MKEYADFGYEPSCMGLAPVGAIATVLSRARLTLKDFAVCEINEAFASVVLGIMRILDSSVLMERKFVVWLDRAVGRNPARRSEPHGGAIALGHPVGCRGLRLAMTALFQELKRRNAERALISMCVGGGQGVAMILERK